MKNSKEKYVLYPIGYIKRENDNVYIDILEKYVTALKQLNHFSHVQILWWGTKTDTEEHRHILECTPPYGENPPVTGVFATRAEYRPNPILLTTARILDVDHKNGIIKINNIDALDNTPVIDLKAYFPVCDRVRDASIPEWIVGWPEWYPEEGLGIN